MSLKMLIERAFRQGSAYQANQLIDEVRAQTRGQHGEAINYEVMAMGRPFEYLQREVAPRMTFYLHSKRRGMEVAFVSLFVNMDTLVFIRAADFLDVIRLSMNLDEEAFDVVLRGWARTGAAPASALLPAPPDEEDA